ncbi:MAG: hypothetical protein IKN58_06715 [Prevotella sp.]|nr:hypothetical protein [Prevotella sp.]
MDQSDNKIDPKKIFGLRGIWIRYYREFFKDLLWPIVFSIVLLCFARHYRIYSPLVLQEAIKVGIAIIPVLLSVLVAGYVLLLTIYFSGNIENFKSKKKGQDMLYAISANYALCIINSIIALVITIIISFFFQMELTSKYHTYVNYTCSAIVYVLLFYTLKNLKDLVLSLFDFGQSFIFERQLEKNSDSNTKEKNC